MNIWSWLLAGLVVLWISIAIWLPKEDPPHVLDMYLIDIDFDLHDEHGPVLVLIFKLDQEYTRCVIEYDNETFKVGDVHEVVVRSNGSRVLVCEGLK